MLFGNTLYVMRVFNLGAIIGMLGLAAFPVRRAFGVKASVFCSALFSCSSINLILLHEIRPTYWSIYMFTAVGIYAYLAFFGGKRSDIAVFTVYSVIAMHTHNVAMLGALAVYITMLLFALVQKDKKRFKCFFISGVICAVVYIPWLMVVFKQFGNVKDHFWISSLHTFDQLLHWTVLDPFDYPGGMLFTCTYILIAAFVCVWMLRHVRWNKLRAATKFSDVLVLAEDKQTYVKAAFLIVIYLLSIAILMLFNEIAYPIASQRYFSIFSGVLLIVVSVALANSNIRVLPYALILLFSLCFINDNVKLHQSINIDSLNAQDMIDHLVSTEEEIVFLHGHEGTLGIMSYHFPQAKHLVCDDTFTVLNTYDVFTTDVQEIGDIRNISKYCTEFYVKNEDDVHVDELKLTTDLLDAAGIEYELTEIGSYYMPYAYEPHFELAKITLTEAS